MPLLWTRYRSQAHLNPQVSYRNIPTSTSQLTQLHRAVLRFPVFKSDSTAPFNYPTGDHRRVEFASETCRGNPHASSTMRQREDPVSISGEELWAASGAVITATSPTEESGIAVKHGENGYRTGISEPGNPPMGWVAAETDFVIQQRTRNAISIRRAR